jgi:hypothetical protein
MFTVVRVGRHCTATIKLAGKHLRLGGGRGRIKETAQCAMEDRVAVVGNHGQKGTRGRL